MLVLKRKIGEKLLIPSCDLALTVLSVKGTRVQVGISAPRSIAVSLKDVRRHAGDQEQRCSPKDWGQMLASNV
jgi:carbon storage regulator CsrA